VPPGSQGASIFASARIAIVRHQRPDTIIYVNVLEHIEDDRAELAMIYDSLEEGGHALIFVPALMALYGPFDERIGHYRRYSKGEIEEKCRSAGFEIVLSKYFDLAGVLPWFVKYRLLRSDSLGSGAVKIYDKLVVPIAKPFERLINIPLGKNVLMAVRKPVSARGFR